MGTTCQSSVVLAGVIQSRLVDVGDCCWMAPPAVAARTRPLALLTRVYWPLPTVTRFHSWPASPAVAALRTIVLPDAVEPALSRTCAGEPWATSRLAICR